MSDLNISLIYNNIKRNINFPKNFIELENSFIKEFKEEKNKLFLFTYIEFIDKESDFKKLINQFDKKSKNFINVSQIKENNNFNREKQKLEEKNIENIYKNFLKKKRNNKKESKINNKNILIKKEKNDISSDYIENNEKGLKLLEINENKKYKKIEELESQLKEIILENKKLKEININILKENKELEIVYNQEIKNKEKYINSIKKLKKELEEKDEIIKAYRSNPDNIQFKEDLTSDSYTTQSLDNSFSVFKATNDLLYLVYSNNNKSIISINLINKQKIHEIKNAHNWPIICFRYYLDKIKKIDLIISISADDNNIKLWKVNNWECILNMKNINKVGSLYSACFLYNNNQNYILTTKYNILNDSELIKVFDFKGNKIKELNDSNDNTYFIDTFYDNKYSKNYIITGNNGSIKSYDYNENKIYHNYDDNNNRIRSIYNAIINKQKEEIKLIESSTDGYIRIWNFHSGKLLSKIKVINHSLYSLCLWDEKYLFVGCWKETIKLIDLDNRKIIKDLKVNTENIRNIISIKKIIHPKYGECLISQGIFNSQIKLWIKYLNK